MQGVVVAGEAVEVRLVVRNHLLKTMACVFSLSGFRSRSSAGAEPEPEPEQGPESEPELAEAGAADGSPG